MKREAHRSTLRVGLALIAAFSLFLISIFGDSPVLAAGIADNSSATTSASAALTAQISQRSSDIAALEREIAGYQTQIDSLGTQATSLAGTLASLDLTRKKLQANISLTQDNIVAQNEKIGKLDVRIAAASSSITEERRAIARALKDASEQGSKSPLEIFFSEGSFSRAWTAFDRISRFDNALVNRIAALKSTKRDYESSRKTVSAAKAQLVSLTSQLAAQRSAVLAAAAEKKQLLADTKNSEAQYQKLVSQKKAQKDAFEKELANYESQLHLLTDSSLIPHPGTGILAWPLDVIKITQYFGNTAFSAAHSQVYNGKGHTGVDFAAAIGTPVKAAANGTVIGVGNTDLVAGCYSYGKWVMISHPGGLSTLYAHLSVQGVSTGSTVSAGQIIGYSGNTGYTTGPHLHFGVYATAGVKIASFDTSKNCKGVLLPLADYKAYLNPLSYL